MPPGTQHGAELRIEASSSILCCFASWNLSTFLRALVGGENRQESTVPSEHDCMLAPDLKLGNQGLEIANLPSPTGVYKDPQLLLCSDFPRL